MSHVVEQLVLQAAFNILEQKKWALCSLPLSDTAATNKIDEMTAAQKILTEVRQEYHEHRI